MFTIGAFQLNNPGIPPQAQSCYPEYTLICDTSTFDSHPGAQAEGVVRKPRVDPKTLMPLHPIEHRVLDYMTVMKNYYLKYNRIFVEQYLQVPLKREQMVTMEDRKEVLPNRIEIPGKYWPSDHFSLVYDVNIGTRFKYTGPPPGGQKDGVKMAMPANNVQANNVPASKS